MKQYVYMYMRSFEHRESKFHVENRTKVFENQHSCLELILTLSYWFVRLCLFDFMVGGTQSGKRGDCNAQLIYINRGYNITSFYPHSIILSLSRARVYTFVYQCAKVVRKNANWVT